MEINKDLAKLLQEKYLTSGYEFQGFNYKFITRVKDSKKKKGELIIKSIDKEELELTFANVRTKVVFSLNVEIPEREDEIFVYIYLNLMKKIAFNSDVREIKTFLKFQKITRQILEEGYSESWKAILEKMGEVESKIDFGNKEVILNKEDEGSPDSSC